MQQRKVEWLCLVLNGSSHLLPIYKQQYRDSNTEITELETPGGRFLLGTLFSCSCLSRYKVSFPIDTESDF